LRAKVSFPIIGADFLKFFDLMVDLKRMPLVKGNGSWAVPLVAPAPGSTFAALGVAPADPLCFLDHMEEATCGRSTETTQGKFNKLLQAFPEVLNPSKVLPAAKHHVKHRIVTLGPASAARYRRLDPIKLRAAREEFRQLEEQGIVRWSFSHWASPLHMVRKADGSWRLCGDFCLVNAATRPDRYTSPNLADLTACLDGCKVFSKLDLRKGYHQVPVEPEDICKTAVIIQFGLFEYTRLPFSLRNAAQMF